LVTVREMLNAELTIGEVDSITGPLIGRPRSATFRTLDVVGLDTFFHVAKNVYDQVEGEEKEVFDSPDFMKKMLENKWLGAKTSKGFYEKVRGKDGSEILQLNPDTMEFEPRNRLKTTATEVANQQKGTKRKIKT